MFQSDQFRSLLELHQGGETLTIILRNETRLLLGKERLSALTKHLHSNNNILRNRH